MAQKTPDEWLKDIKKGGLLIVQKGSYFFIPNEILTACELPKEFHADDGTISNAYFKPVNAPAPGATPPDVHSGLARTFSKFPVADGVDQAILIQPEAGTKKSISSELGKILFQYDGNSGKIEVDLSKGGKASDGT